MKLSSIVKYFIISFFTFLIFQSCKTFHKLPEAETSKFPNEISGGASIIVVYDTIIQIDTIIRYVEVFAYPSHEIVSQIKYNPLLSKHFTGFALWDPENDSMICEFNADKYFTPASNMKLFSLFSALRILPDSVPAFAYIETGDSLIFTGTGNPALLYYPFTNLGNKELLFLKNSKKKLYYNPINNNVKALGLGWAWDDYNAYYSAEMGDFPIYGNIVNFRLNGNGTKPTAFPSYFNKCIEKNTYDGATKALIRERDNNIFLWAKQNDDSAYNQCTPFRYSQELAIKLLSEHLSKEVGIIENPLAMPKAKIFYSFPMKLLLKEMMLESDNFIAEQNLLMCSYFINGTINTETTIEYVLKKHLASMPDYPRWVDGSGLSRYNLVTPRSFVYLLDKLYNDPGIEYLVDIFPQGGVSGTLSNSYKAPYVYVIAKTGTISNNHCLSGFIKTKSGKYLIFSFMNNHYRGRTRPIIAEMERILHRIYQLY